MPYISINQQERKKNNHDHRNERELQFVCESIVTSFRMIRKRKSLRMIFLDIYAFFHRGWVQTSAFGTRLGNGNNRFVYSRNKSTGTVRHRRLN